jgi:coenzyme F420 hydrogenase subunit beta
VTVAASLDAAVAEVVGEGNCSGCGLCAALDGGLEMRLDAAGFNRPERVGRRESPRSEAEDVRIFGSACPGVRVRAQYPDGATRHPTMGPVVQAWRAWATDPETRYVGSSGGTLTALSAWLISTGRVAQAVGAAQAPANPRRTVSVQLTTRDEALAAAGSRYAPVSTCAASGALDPTGAVIAKPCEASALRAFASATGTDAPLLLSFYCAGTPSQHATDALASELGVQPGEPVRRLWYRGHGWPGSFTVERADASIGAISYDESWGRKLGPSVQWRCKVCADGVGESSDITAADLWHANERGYPDFTEGAGVSALVARTERGRQVVLDAAASGILTLEPLDIFELDGVQPLQRQRRLTLAGRLLGTRLAGGTTPTYTGFGLISLALPRLREIARVARATRARRLARKLP